MPPDYDTYGKLRTASEASSFESGTDAEKAETAYRYTGKRSDPVSETTHHGARQYSALTRSWLVTDQYLDPLADLGLSMDPTTRDRTQYAGGNPMNYVDDDGHAYDCDGSHGCDAANENYRDHYNDQFHSGQGSGSSSGSGSTPCYICNGGAGGYVASSITPPPTPTSGGSAAGGPAWAGMPTTNPVFQPSWMGAMSAAMTMAGGITRHNASVANRAMQSSLAEYILRIRTQGQRGTSGQHRLLNAVAEQGGSSRVLSTAARVTLAGGVGFELGVACTDGSAGPAPCPVRGAARAVVNEGGAALTALGTTGVCVAATAGGGAPACIVGGFVAGGVYAYNVPPRTNPVVDAQVNQGWSGAGNGYDSLQATSQQQVCWYAGVRC